MLSIGKLSPGRADYYLDTVAKGAEEYYLGAGEAPGYWAGQGANQLGLTGEVTGVVLRNVLAGRSPAGEPLIARQGPQRMPGFDCTFNAPKSVSLLFALGTTDIRRQVSEAHDAAVAAALGVLETEACRVRRGRGGANVLPGDGFVAAGFRHRTSRSGDPHLHTHVVVANLARRDADGRWTALDGRHLYTWCRTAGFLYETQLRAELTARLGVQWGPIRSGIADIDGVPRRVIDHFSQRRREINDRMEQVGSLGGHAAQVAAYATRQAKDTNVRYATLKERWTKRADALGFTPKAIEGLCDTSPRQYPSRTSINTDELYQHLDAPSGLTAHRSTFDRRDVIRAICEQLPDGASTSDVTELADEYLASRHVVALSEPHTDLIRRSDGNTAPAPTDQHRWTTPDMLRVERNLIEMATARRGTEAGLVDASVLEAAITTVGNLSDEQETLVRRICRSGDGVEVVPGIAGSGKTHALSVAHKAWTQSGYTVVGLALSAQAARQLQSGSGIPSSTIARYQLDAKRPDTPGLTAAHVVVIDEAAMVGTRTLVHIIATVHRVGAKAVLVGDACQLPEIEAGGAFAGLTKRTNPARLQTNRRQHAPWERQALADLRLGHAPEALAAYQTHDRIHHHPDPDRNRDQMIDRWWDTLSHNGDALMLASRHDVVRDLNERARQQMSQSGRLGDERVRLAAKEFAVGDHVIGLKNNYRTGILNGTRGTVTAIDDKHERFEMTTRAGQRIAVPFSYVEAGNLDHGYAMTVHKAQGITCDHALVLVDETMSREVIYTAMSRGRQGNDLYLAVDTGRDDVAHAPEAVRGPDDVLMDAIRRSTAQQMATDDHSRTV